MSGRKDRLEAVLRKLLAPILISDTWGDDVRDGQLLQKLDEADILEALDLLQRRMICPHCGADRLQRDHGAEVRFVEESGDGSETTLVRYLCGIGCGSFWIPRLEP